MLVISNGAMKSGSTWLYQILLAMGAWKPIPDEYQRAGWNGTGVRPDALKRFLSNVDYHHANFLFKAHITIKQHLILHRPNVFITHISRDMRDAVVSAFYYERMKGLFGKDDFNAFYWTRGRRFAKRLIRYNKLWQSAPGVLATTYEALHADFPSEVSKIGRFVGRNLSGDEIARIAEQTSLGALRETCNEWSADGQLQFFRKGIVGDWQSHLKPDMTEDLLKIERREATYPSALDLGILRLTDLAFGRWFD